MSRSLPFILPADPNPAAMPEFAGTPSGEGRRFAVVASRFNESVTQKLAEGETGALGDTSTLAHPAVVEDLVANRGR